METVGDSVPNGAAPPRTTLDIVKERFKDDEVILSVSKPWGSPVLRIIYLYVYLIHE